MEKICKNCRNFNNQGYKDEARTVNLGFCERFIQVSNGSDGNCIGFDLRVHPFDLEENFKKAKKIELNLDQLPLWDFSI